jgi:hypothetical protein
MPKLPKIEPKTLVWRGDALKYAFEPQIFNSWGGVLGSILGSFGIDFGRCFGWF